MLLTKNVYISFTLLTTILSTNPTISNVNLDFKSRTVPVTSDLPPQDSNQIIPKIFHTIWMNFGKGDTVFPKYVKNMQALQDMHPDWELKLWRESEIIEIIKKHYPEFLHTFTSYDKVIKKHDSARIVLLHHFGGVYLDQDFIPIKNLNPLFRSYSFVAGSEEPNSMTPVNGLMGSIKGFGLLRLYLDRMCDSKIAKDAVLNATGPAIFKKILIEYCEKHGNKAIKVYSNEFFYPIHWGNKHLVKQLKGMEIPEKFPNSYLIQEYDASWQ